RTPACDRYWSVGGAPRPASERRPAKPSPSRCQNATAGSPNCQQRSTCSPSSSHGKSTSPSATSFSWAPSRSISCRPASSSAMSGPASGRWRTSMALDTLPGSTPRAAARLRRSWSSCSALRWRRSSSMARRGTCALASSTVKSFAVSNSPDRALGRRGREVAEEARRQTNGSGRGGRGKSGGSACRAPGGGLQSPRRWPAKIRTDRGGGGEGRGRFDGFEEDISDVPVPDLLPILPLRGLVIFPSAIVPLLISRGASLKLVEDRLSGDRTLGLVSQKNPEEEQPEPDGLY